MIIRFSYSSSCFISEPTGSNDSQKDFQLISARKGIKKNSFHSSYLCSIKKNHFLFLCNSFSYICLQMSFFICKFAVAGSLT